MRVLRHMLWLVVLRCLLVVPGLSGAEPVSFMREVAPVLEERCLTCHAADKSKGGFQLDAFDRLLRPADSGEPPIIPGSPAQSLLFRLITATDASDRMPQKSDPLSPAEIRLIERWIGEGAGFDGADRSAPWLASITRAPHPSPPEVYPRPVPITALAFNPDGREILAGGYHEILFRDTGSGALTRRVPGLPQRIYSFAWHARSNILAVAGGAPGRSGEVLLVDPEAGRTLRTLARTSDVLLSVAFSPDGSRLAAAGADAIIRIWELDGMDEPLQIQGHADWVCGVAWNEEGTRIATASRDRSARLFDARTGDLVATYADHGAPVTVVAFAPDNRRIVSGGRDRRLVYWKIEDGARAAEIGGLEGDIVQLLRAGNHWLVAAADGKLRQYHINDRKLELTYDCGSDPLLAVAFHPESRRIATGGHDGTVRLWRLGAPAPVHSFIAAPLGR